MVQFGLYTLKLAIKPMVSNVTRGLGPPGCLGDKATTVHQGELGTTERLGDTFETWIEPISFR